MHIPVFIDNSKVTKYGTAKPYFQFYLNKELTKIQTKIPVFVKYWNGEAVSTKDDLHAELNDKFNAMRKFIRRAIITNPTISKKELKDSFNEAFFTHPIATENHELSFLEYCNTKLKEDSTIGERTKELYQKGINMLLEFDKNFNWHSISKKGLEKYENYLNEYSYVRGGTKRYYSKSNIKRYLKTFVKFVNLAEEDELIKTNPFKKFSWSAYNRAENQATRRREYLRPNEIEALFSLKNIPGHLQEAYDYAVIAIHSGLALKDMMELDASFIKSYKYKHKGGLAIYKDRGKTEEPLYIPLFLVNDGMAQEVVKKRTQVGGKFFKSNVKTIRDKLKILVAMAGISRNISTHNLRHTFATWMLYKGVDVTVLKQLLGHLKLDTTMIYTHIDEGHINEALLKSNQ